MSSIPTSIGQRPSYAWRSILHGRELLMKGLRNAVGTRDNIYVWMDPWIVDELPRAPYRRPLFFNVILKVCELINRQTRTWDRGKLEENLFPEDIERILKIKPALNSKDSYEWIHNRCGAYTVRSGYWLGRTLNQSDVRREAMVRPYLNTIRARVWTVKTVPKIKVFLWKTLHNALAVGNTLSHRGMKADDVCQICGEEGESINHVLFDCTVARQVWAQAIYPFSRDGFEKMSIYENINYLLDCQGNSSIPNDISRCFPWIVWQLWKNRNTFLFEGRTFTAHETTEKVCEDTNQWFRVKTSTLMEPTENLNVPQSVLRWEAPEQGVMKCNIGVSWSRFNNLGGAAWILRDHKGDVMSHSRKAFSWNG